MYYFYVVVIGIISGLTFILISPRSIQKKVKIDEYNENSTQLPKENIVKKEELSEETKKEQQAQMLERKNKLLRNLSDKDRSLVENYFKKKAEQIMTGKIDPEEKRSRLLFTLIKVLFFLLISLIIYVGLSIAFKTQNPLEIYEALKYMGLQFVKLIVN